MTWRERWGRAVPVAAIFLAFGPPIGSVVIIAVLARSAFETLGAPSSLSGLLDEAITTLSLVFPMSYVVGGIPAGLTGLISGVVSPSIRRLRIWLIVTTSIGFLISAFLMGFFSMSSPEAPLAAVVVGGAGGLAGLVCGWFTRRVRLIPVSSD